MVTRHQSLVQSSARAFQGQLHSPVFLFLPGVCLIVLMCSFCCCCCFICCLQELCKQLDGLQAKRQELEAKVTALAQSGGDLAALEAASTELGRVADEADAAELEWLELAELAGDL